MQVNKVKANWTMLKKVLPSPEKYIKNYETMRSLQIEIEKGYINNTLSKGILIKAKLISIIQNIFKGRYDFKKIKSYFVTKKQIKHL